MDINVARTFLEVVKTGSFVNAAANLNLTQTAVSARIRVLEENLDRKVFVRNKAGARLTPAGEQFFRFATSLVQVWDRARRAAAIAPGRETVVTIGAELSQWNPLMRDWLLWMRRECPEIAISAYIDSAERLMEQVQEGSLDVAILYAAPVRPGIVAELLFEERLVLVRTTQSDRPVGPEDHVNIDWGEDFAASYHAAFPTSALVSFPSAMDRWRSNMCSRKAGAAISGRQSFGRSSR
jgi:DNA-binding transcriptional LysR family regulator